MNKSSHDLKSCASANFAIRACMTQTPFTVNEPSCNEEFQMQSFRQNDRCRIRTCDRTLRRRMLYPAELSDQICEFQQELIWLYVDSQNVLDVYFNRFDQLIRLLYHTLAQL